MDPQSGYLLERLSATRVSDGKWVLRWTFEH